MIRLRIAVGWIILGAAIVGAILSALGVVGKHEPQLVLQLSWFALIYEGFNAVQISNDANK